jgi:hypothetical protein
MVDSDGALKWGPHNGVRNSENLTGTGWVNATSGLSPSITVTDQGGGVFRIQASTAGTISNDFAILQQEILGFSSGASTAKIDMKSNTGSSQSVYFRIGSADTTVVESSDAVASFHSITQQITGLANNTVYTISLFLKQSGRSRARVSLLNKNGDNPGAIFDLAAGVVVSELVGVISSNIEDAGNGWYRCVITANSASGATTPQLRLWPADTSNNIQYIGDGVSGLFVWGAQLLFHLTLHPDTAQHSSTEQ